MTVLKNFNLSPYEIPFKKALEIKGQKLTHKNGYYLQIESDENIQGIGELSFLKNWHPHDLSYYFKEIEQILKQLKNQEIYWDKLDLTQKGFNLFNSLPDLSPCSLFALESALLDLIFKSSHFQHDIPSHFEIPYNGLYTPDPNDNLVEAIKTFKEQKITTLKIKIGRLAFEQEKEILQVFFEKAKSSFRYRFDGNKNLTLEQFEKYLTFLPLSLTEYFEEPLKNIQDWNKFAGTYPLALDESLEDYSQGKISFNPKAIVLKPTSWGGISGCYQLIQESSKLDIPIVTSSTFETPTGMRALAFLAHEQNKHHPIKAGLDTLSSLDSYGLARFYKEGSFYISQHS